MTKPEDVLAFWLDELTPRDWYVSCDAVDEKICKRFMEAWRQANEGAFAMWLTYPSGALAYLILTDQFPRNMFRQDGRAFDTDRAALAAAKSAISKSWDMRIDAPARQFFYLPLMHSEIQSDQDRCVRLLLERMPGGDQSNLLHARAHREVIRRFGRFPYRNAVLLRHNTSLESDFLQSGGYGSILTEMEQAIA